MDKATANKKYPKRNGWYFGSRNGKSVPKRSFLLPTKLTNHSIFHSLVIDKQSSPYTFSLLLIMSAQKTICSGVAPK